MRVTAEVNHNLNRLYSSIRQGITGSGTQTVREWLRSQSYEEARRFGLEALDKVQRGIWP